MGKGASSRLPYLTLFNHDEVDPLALPVGACHWQCHWQCSTIALRSESSDFNKNTSDGNQLSAIDESVYSESLALLKKLKSLRIHIPSISFPILFTRRPVRQQEITAAGLAESSGLSTARINVYGFLDHDRLKQVAHSMCHIKGSVKAWRAAFPVARSVNVSKRSDIVDADFVQIRGDARLQYIRYERMQRGH